MRYPVYTQRVKRIVLICQKTQSAIDDVFRQLDEAAAEATIEQQNTGWCNYKMKGSRKTLVKIQHDMILERDTYDQVFSKSNDSEEELNSCLAQSSDKEKYKRDNDNQYRNVANYVFRSKRYAAKEDKRWPRKIIHYNISEFDHKGRENILEAMRVWSKYTCLKFTERAHEFDYINIVPSDERGPQFISLNNNSCMDIPIILHELGHAIGLYHEHSRPDRDKFVFVHYNNITKNMSHEFDKIDPREYVNFNKPYDYRSIMHYSKRAFAANPNGITLETIDEDYADIIGKATVLSFYDVMLVNAMYNCSEDCTNKTCPDKGFLTESCDCYCPSNSTSETWTKCPGDYCQPPNIDF
ncbi:hypothetical protein DPMN_153669 [Dreissena polymorpha]|uniref:Metalloendopeptidase n=1 Tax=Dreissena polymorpha TaxID=45954 RepID=A0A9D4J8G3_DREPO|nr:hypothetical protein DPMN_153669 [Dreissena polymorpha]